MHSASARRNEATGELTPSIQPRKEENCLLDQLEHLFLGHLHNVLTTDENDVITDAHSGRVGRKARFHSFDPEKKKFVLFFQNFFSN